VDRRHGVTSDALCVYRTALAILQGTAMTEMMRVEHEGFVATVTIDRPDKLNAMSQAMWGRLGEIFAALSADDGVRAIILTGAGDRAFCVGADIAEFDQVRSTAEQARAYGRLVHGAIDAIASCRHPVIAAIRGLCVGGGLELATNCDMRLCESGSRFGIPVKRLGLVVAYAELRPLVQLVGPANANEILLEGSIFGAADAHRIGLVNRVVADDQVMAEAKATALRIAEGAPLVARWHKKFVRRLMDPTPLMPAENDESFHCFDTEDFRIGREAFVAKTTPAFVGR